MGIIFQKPPNNYQYYVGQSNLVNYRFDTVNQTAPVTNATLHTNLIIPGKTVVQDGQILYVYAAGNMGAHAGTSATIIAQLNGTSVFIGTSAANASAHAWEMFLRFLCVNKASNQATLFGNYETNLAQASATAVAVSILGARNFLNPFGGAGFGFDVDNTLQFLTTDAGGAEIITQEFTQIWVQ